MNTLCLEHVAAGVGSRPWQTAALPPANLVAAGGGRPLPCPIPPEEQQLPAKAGLCVSVEWRQMQGGSWCSCPLLQMIQKTLK